MDQPLPRLAFSVDEVAEMYGCSEKHIRRLVKAGTLEIVPHMGRRVLIPIAELERTTADLAERWGCGISSISARWRAGKMPAPCNADQQRGFRWHRTVIDAYERGDWQAQPLQ